MDILNFDYSGVRTDELSDQLFQRSAQLGRSSIPVLAAEHRESVAPEALNGPLRQPNVDLSANAMWLIGGFTQMALSWKSVKDRACIDARE